MDNLPDRQDLPIWNAIEAKNLKQALKLVDKRLAKKATDYLEALKIYIRSLLPQISEKSVVLLHLEELVTRNTVLSDLAAIELYEDALEEVLPGSQESWIKTIGELRWRLVKACPKNEDTSLTCLQTCLSRDDLDHARQIANNLEKNFPKNHSYIFWNITSMFLFSLSPQCPENQRKIWGGLASGQIGKLATATRQATDLKQLPIKSIHTPQELLLLDRITEAFGKPEQRLDYLQDSHLGPESTVAKGEWGLWRLKLRLMEEANLWQELFKVCGTLLKRARTANYLHQLAEASFSDWMVWEAYFQAAGKLNDHRYYEDIRSEVKAHLDPACKIDKSWKRNASLAKVKFIFESSTAFSQDNFLEDVRNGTNMTRLSAVVDYLQEYGDANTAYNDIRKFVEALKLNERVQLLSMLEGIFALEKSQQPIGPVSPEVGSRTDSKKLSTASEIARAINRLKLRYLIISSIPEHERRQSLATQQGFTCSFCTSDCGLFCQNCLVLLAEESIKCYQSAVHDDAQVTQSLLATDRHPADDICILATMCLTKLWLKDATLGSHHLKHPGTTYLLQATVLLESAWSRSKSNFQVSLMLIRLYSYIGCGLLAMRAYQRLFLKQVQLDTLSYTMFDRISTFHPHPISDLDESSNTRTLLEQLQKQQKLYKSSREHINKNIWLAFKHGSYNSIFEFREVGQRLSHSLSAVMSVVESNRIYRFATNTVPAAAISQMSDLIPAELGSMEGILSDNNDYESFPNFESSRAPRFEELSRFIPSPSGSRYRMNILAEKVMLIVDLSPDLSGQRDILQQSLKRDLDSQSQEWPPKVGLKTLTRTEQLASHAYHAMALIITESFDKELWAEGDFKTRMETLHQELCDRLREQAELVEALQFVVPAFQTVLNAIYTTYEVARTALNFCKYLTGKGTAVHESQADANKKLALVAEQLMQVVMEKCAFIKKGLDDGGWIDTVLERVLPDSMSGHVQSGDPLVLLLEAVRQVPDEIFMEGWAGEVVESWKDSVAGFSYIKMPTEV